MNGRAEMVAVVSAAEAIDVLLDAFPKGVEFVIGDLGSLSRAPQSREGCLEY
jgi:hypothetical protein